MLQLQGGGGEGGIHGTVKSCYSRKDIKRHLRNVENNRLQLSFSAFPLSSRMLWFFDHFVFSIEVKDLDCKFCKCFIRSHDCLFLLQENSLKEWCYNYAITIETYDDYDPIPVPFNIIYSIAKLLALVKKKKKRQVLLNIYRNGGSPWVKITNLVNTLNIPWCSQLKSFSNFL